MPSLVLVAIGGAIGALSRFAIDRLVTSYIGTTVLGILLINIVGSFCLGFIIGYWQIDREYAESSRLLLGVGILGSFTTFSTLTVSVVQMGSDGEFFRGFIYLSASIIFGLFAALIGMMIQKIIF
jgi:CrcB protein